MVRLRAWTDERIAEYERIRDDFLALMGSVDGPPIAIANRNRQTIKIASTTKDGNGFYPGKVVYRTIDGEQDGPNVWVDTDQAGAVEDAIGHGIQSHFAASEADETDVRAVFYVPEFTAGERSFLSRLTKRYTWPGVTTPLYNHIRQDGPTDAYGYESGATGGVGAFVTAENTIEANGVDVSDEWTVTVSGATGCTLCLEIDGSPVCLPYDADASEWDAEVGAGITVTGSLVFTFDGDFDAHTVEWVQPRRLCPPPNGEAIDWNGAKIVTDADAGSGNGRRVRMFPGKTGNLSVRVTRTAAGDGESTFAEFDVVITDAAGGTLTPVVDGVTLPDSFTPYDPASAIEAAFGSPTPTVSGLTESAAGIGPKVISFTVTFDYDFDDHTLSFVNGLTEIRIYHFDGGADYDLCRQRYADPETISGWNAAAERDLVHRVVPSTACNRLEEPDECPVE